MFDIVNRENSRTVAMPMVAVRDSFQSEVARSVLEDSDRETDPSSVGIEIGSFAGVPVTHSHGSGKGFTA
jgi:hypothetical protein